ncbi:hypothetical protein ABGB12_11720 [Actinocorallia sp. B10E7]
MLSVSRRVRALYPWERVAEGTEAVYARVAARVTVPIGEARS